MYLVRPRPLAKCGEHDSQLDVLKAKELLEVFLGALGLHEKGRQREAARYLRVGESTLRGWRKRSALDRRPTEEALLRLDAEIVARIRRCG